ncbi:MAG: hypothetical protein V1492_00875 [Candidatus Micrarchaeota archaeon]
MDDDENVAIGMLSRKQKVAAGAIGAVSLVGGAALLVLTMMNSQAPVTNAPVEPIAPQKQEAVKELSPAEEEKLRNRLIGINKEKAQASNTDTKMQKKSEGQNGCPFVNDANLKELKISFKNDWVTIYTERNENAPIVLTVALEEVLSSKGTMSAKEMENVFRKKIIESALRRQMTDPKAIERAKNALACRIVNKFYAKIAAAAEPLRYTSERLQKILKGVTSRPLEVSLKEGPNEFVASIKKTVEFEDEKREIPPQKIDITIKARLQYSDTDLYSPCGYSYLRGTLAINIHKDLKLRLKGLIGNFELEKIANDAATELLKQVPKDSKKKESCPSHQLLPSNIKEDSKRLVRMLDAVHKSRTQGLQPTKMQRMYLPRSRV